MMIKPTPKPRPAIRPSALADRYAAIRQASLALAAPLSAEDCQVQSMPDASPTKWHLAHVDLVLRDLPARALRARLPALRSRRFRVLFNSYYNGVGEQYPRPQRGLVTRPTLAEVKRFRAEVDERMLALLAGDRAMPRSRRWRRSACTTSSSTRS